MLRPRIDAKLCSAALFTVMCSTVQAADFPAEITDPCVVFGFCAPAQIGASGSASVFSGSAILTGSDFTKAGSLADPWLLNLDTTGASTHVFFANGGTGGPLASPTNLNPTGSGHATGRYFLIQLRNTSGTGWNLVRLDLEFQLNTPSSDHDALSFGEGTVTEGDPDLFSTFGSNRFSTVNRVPATFVPDAYDLPTIGLINDRVTDALVFTGGNVQPNETVNLLVAINSGVDAGIIPDFYLKVQAGSDIPEPATMCLAGLGLGMVAIARRRRVI